MYFEKVKENSLNKRVEKIKDNLNSANEVIVSQHNMKSFRIVKGDVIKLDPDIFNGALNSHCKRMYLKTMLPCNPQGFISYLKELSHDVEVKTNETETVFSVKTFMKK